MAKKLMQGDSRQIDTPCYPTQFGCDESAAVKYPYDPAKAKQLLAEAGYPNGFDTELVTFMPQQFPASVQAYLRAVGINAKMSRPAGAGRNPAGHGRQHSDRLRQLGQLLDQ